MQYRLTATLVLFAAASFGVCSVAHGTGDHRLASDPQLAAVPDRDTTERQERSRILNAARDDAARWLLEHDDPRKQAAGLLDRISVAHSIELQRDWSERLLQHERVQPDGPVGRAATDGIDRVAAASDDLAEFQDARLLTRIERQIRRTTDGAALAWLATTCRIAGIQAFCIEAGLDEAIVRHDGANLFSRGALFDDPERFPELVLEARATDNHVLELVRTWFEALAEADPEARLSDHDRLVASFSWALAHAVPAYGPLSITCGPEVVPGSRLDIACERVLEALSRNSDTAIARLVSLTIQAERAEARGRDPLADEIEARKQRLHERFSCAARSSAEVLERDEGGAVAEYIALISEHGELEGQLRFAESRGIDCSDGEPLVAAN